MGRDEDMVRGFGEDVSLLGKRLIVKTFLCIRASAMMTMTV